MSEAVAERIEGAPAARTLAWVAGAAVGSLALSQVVFMVTVVGAEMAAIAFSFTARVGVPVFGAVAALAVGVFAALTHLIVRRIGKSKRVPWVIWPAMVAPPALWTVIALVETAGVLEPMLSIMQLAGIAVAFVTLGRQRYAR